MITKLSIQNYRSFKDLTSINLKPITILLGANSIGKSSLLRVIPLFKQSILYNRNEPIVWYDDNLVDLGSFDISKNKNSDIQQPMNFSFEYEIDNYGLRALQHKIWFRRRCLLHKDISTRKLLDVNKIIVKVGLDISKKVESGTSETDNYSKSYYSNIIIHFLDYKITIKNGIITINGLKVGNKINEISNSKDDELSRGEVINIDNYNFDDPDDIMKKCILKNLYMHGKAQNEYKKRKFLSIPLSDKNTFETNFKEITNKKMILIYYMIM